MVASKDGSISSALCYTLGTMRCRSVLAIVSAVALTFLILGGALGYWVIPDSKGPSATCIILRGELEDGRWLQLIDDDPTRNDYYDDNCR